MLARFAGVHIHQDILKVGVAFYPDKDDKCYPLQYVSVPIIPESGIPEGLEDEAFGAWLENLPTKMQLNPAFTHFIRIDPSTTKTQLEQEIQRIFTPDVLTSADTFLSDRGITHRQSFSQFRKLMQPRERLGSGLVLPKGYDAEKILKKVNKNLKNLEGELDSKGRILDIEPGTITIGAAATDRGAWTSVANQTIITAHTVASDTGTIKSVQIYAYTSMSDTEVATFIDEGSDTFSTRDSEAIGSVTSGSTQTFSGLDMDVSAGDYIGLYASAGALEVDTTGGGGFWKESGDQIPSSSVVFNDYIATTWVCSLYGEGTESLTQQAVGGGAITPTGALGLKTKITVGAGSITPTGALSTIYRFLQSTGSGTITPVGTLGRKIALAVGAGAITPAATLGRKILIAVGAGAITPTGALATIRKIFQSVGGGAITPVGTLGRLIKLALGGGAITPVGALGRKILLAVGSGAITPAGALNRLIKIAVGAGSITPTGALTAVRKIFQVVGSGAVTPIGTLGRKIKIGVGAGAITPAGILGRKIFISVGGGAVSIAGTLGRKVKLLVGQGAVAISGALNRLIKITVGQGAVTIVGTLATFWEWIVLTLRPKSLALTLQHKTLALTLKVKSLALSLLKKE